MYEKTQKLIYRLLCAALIAAGAVIGLRWLLPWLTPFILAMAIAALSEPAVRWLVRRRVMPRAGAAGLCTVLLLALIIAMLVLGTGRGISELGSLAGRLPEFFSALSEKIVEWQGRILSYIDAAPDGAGKYLQTVFDTVTEQLSGLPGWLSGRLLGFVTGFAAKLPSILLFVITGGIGAYFCSSSYPEILGFIKRQIPAGWQSRAKIAYESARQSIWRWARAQLIMTAITFFELLAAFLLLRTGYSLLLAAVIALIDMLPVLGTGTVLIPWALFELLTGNRSLAVGLIITYAVISFVRSVIQAKLLGDQLGLHPIVTLIAIYVGFRALGVWGMILFPILAVVLKQLHDHKVIKLWKGEKE